MRREAEEFICRDLSWLDFDRRVLDEAACAANPLLERLKFIAISANNLDEFFMVRIAGLHQLVQARHEEPDPSGLRPSEQLRIARRKITLLCRRQEVLLGEVLGELAGEGISIVPLASLPAKERKRLARYFRTEILPVLTPLAAAEGSPFPCLNAGAIQLALELIPGYPGAPAHAFVEIPEVLPRFLPLPGENGTRFLLLEELVAAHVEELFPAGCRTLLPCRITRDMDFDLTEDCSEDQLQTIGRSLRLRKNRAPIRLEVQGELNTSLGRWLRKKLELPPEFCYRVAGPLALAQFSALPDLAGRADLQDPDWPVTMPPEFSGGRPILETIREKGSILLAPPYHPFTPLLRLLNEAADDPDVLAIKQTLYRVSGNSPVVAALRRAAENGKQVTVLVELKARFDEGNNILWAQKLDHSGAHVIYGMADLKVHCKAVLIIRREANGLHRYVHLATGNYNDQTARLYTDCGIFSDDSGLCTDVSDLFNLLTSGNAFRKEWRKCAVSPATLRPALEALIRREIRAAKAGRPASITAKMNSFSDSRMVRMIHRAAAAGVRIDLIVRGICCYRPRPEEKHVRIVSIVDRYLEHSRIFRFENGGKPEYFLSSADWMTRNLDRRVELMFPAETPRVRAALENILATELQDRFKGRELRASGNYAAPRRPGDPTLRSQLRIAKWFAGSGDPGTAERT